MPTAAENVATAIDNIASQLVDMTANPKPSYSIGSRSVSWTEHFRSLTDQLRALNELQQQLDPFEYRSIIL